MRDAIAFTWASPYKNIAEKLRKTFILDNDDFQTEGKYLYYKENGTKIEKEYHLSGWIGIHVTIEQRNALDENFVRNSVYQPNRLRLYVRNKLAVADYFSISPSTQAMANYIEGEISFDILDDDDLPDIATSSRQDFLDDERIKLLIEVVDPILKKLFKLRNGIGKQISDENEEYKQYLLKVEQEKREQEEKARQQAEEQARKAQEEKKEAQEKYEEAKTEASKYHAQSNTIFSSLSEDQKSFSAKTHLIKTNALTIRNGITSLAKKIGLEKYREIGAIAVATDKILSALKYSALAKFDIENEYINEDLFEFCNEYLINVLGKQYFKMNFEVNIQGEYRIRFNPQHITLMLDNLVSNSEKSNSTVITCDMLHDENNVQIIVADDGNGFNGTKWDAIFEFGYSNTGGTGIGLYNVSTVVKKLHGTITCGENEPKGAKFVITLP